MLLQSQNVHDAHHCFVSHSVASLSRAFKPAPLHARTFIYQVNDQQLIYSETSAQESGKQVSGDAFWQFEGNFHSQKAAQLRQLSVGFGA